MSNNIDNRAIAVSVKIYERLLATYPAAFRREYGPAMKQLFRDQCRDAWSEARGRGLVALWLRVLPDLAKTSFVEHLSSVNQRESVFMKMFRGLRADPRLRSTFMRAFALVFIGAIVCSVLMALWLPRTYSSTVRIELVNDLPEATTFSQQFTNSDPYFMVTQFKIIESYSILTNVIADLHLREKLPAQLGKRPWTLDETFAYLSKAIEVKQTRMTNPARGHRQKSRSAIGGEYCQQHRLVVPKHPFVAMEADPPRRNRGISEPHDCPSARTQSEARISRYYARKTGGFRTGPESDKQYDDRWRDDGTVGGAGSSGEGRLP